MIRAWSAFRARMRDGWFILHLACCLVPTWFCVVFTVTPRTFASSPLWGGVAALGNERTWTVICGICAALGFWGAFSRWRPAKMIAAMALGTLHGFIATMFMQVNPWSTGAGTYTIIAALSYCLTLEQTHGD